MRGSKLSGQSATPEDGPVIFYLPSWHAGGRMKEIFKIAVVVFEAIALMVPIVGAVISIRRFFMQMFQETDRHEYIGISERALALVCCWLLTTWLPPTSFLP